MMKKVVLIVQVEHSEPLWRETMVGEEIGGNQQAIKERFALSFDLMNGP